MYLYYNVLCMLYFQLILLTVYLITAQCHLEDRHAVFTCLPVLAMLSSESIPKLFMLDSIVY